MNTAMQDRSDATRAGEALTNQYQSMLDGWADVSKCCLEAADDIYQTGIEYVRDQTEHLHEMTCDPSAAMREETYSNMIDCSLDAADRIAQAYLHSIESVREPLMRVVSAQLPMGRTMMGTLEQGMERGMETLQKGAERMEKTVRGTTQTAERGATRGAEAARHQAQQGRRKSA